MPGMGEAGSSSDSAIMDGESTSDAGDSNAPMCQGCTGPCYQGLCAKRLFASSKTYDGAGIQSTKHADDECAAMAKAAGINGFWLAWISDELGHSPATRFGAPYPGPYVLAKSPTIRVVKTADDFPKKLEHAIDHDENGMPVSGLVYTQTDPWGDVVFASVTTGNACNDWTAGAGDGSFASSMMGSIGDLNDGWTIHIEETCDTIGRIYCFEQ
jgi:hypothetical protein